MQYINLQMLRSLDKLRAQSESTSHSQIRHALDYCCKNLGFEKFAYIDILPSYFTLTYFSTQESQVIIENKSASNVAAFASIKNNFIKEDVLGIIADPFKSAIERMLNCSIKSGIFCKLESIIAADRRLLFFSTSTAFQQPISRELVEQIEFLIPLISSLFDRDAFKKILKDDIVRFQKTIQTASLPMALLDNEMRFVTYNKQWLIHNEINEPNIIGRTIAEVMPRFPAQWSSIHSICLDGKIEINRDDMYVKVDGTKRYLRWTASPWFDLTGQIKGIIITVDSNEELAQKRDLALNESKMKTEFLAHMSHEIRTPLNGISCVSDLLLETNLDEKQVEFAKMIKSCSDSLCSIVTEILDISKIEAGAIEIENIPFSLDEIIEDTKSVFLPLAEKKGLSFKIQKNILPENRFLGDPTRVRQIIYNLLSNALKFTHSGSVSLTCEEVKLNDDESKINCSVTDSGLGINETQLKSLFAPFKQAQASIARVYGGSGLGLFISKKLVELMHGEIAVQSELNVGSSFSFNIKLTHFKEVEKKSTATSSNLERLSQTEPNILLVDDDQINRKVALLYLQRMGLTADTAADGFEALKACTNKYYDLILMDCQMAGMDGYTATKKIRALQFCLNEKKTKIVAVTANASKEDMSLCLSSGMDDYLPKPIKFIKFKEIIASNLSV